MSVNPDGMDRIDYSDFEYQQIVLQHLNEELTGSPAISVLQTTHDVLSGIGGLDNNEVAELAWLELQVAIEHDQDESDQDVGSETLFDGSFGANLPATRDVLPGVGTSPNSTTVSESNVTGDSIGSSLSEDRIFAMFNTVNSPAFDDQTNGPGGAGNGNTYVIKRPYRNMVGRGPVLDSSDDITVVSRLTQEDEIIDSIGQVTAHLVWDVAEVSDAGRAFSVPN